MIILIKYCLTKVMCYVMLPHFKFALLYKNLLQKQQFKITSFKQIIYYEMKYAIIKKNSTNSYKDTFLSKIIVHTTYLVEH